MKRQVRVYAPRPSYPGNIDKEAFRSSFREAVRYVTEVKSTFQNEEEKYAAFLRLVGDFRKQRNNKGRVLARMNRLLDGHPNLILGLNYFVPESCKIDVISDPEKDLRRRSVEDALGHLMRVKSKFRDQEHKYTCFLGILKDFKANRINMATLTARVKELLEGCPNLVVEFNSFLPEGHRIILDVSESEQSLETAVED